MDKEKLQTLIGDFLEPVHKMDCAGQIVSVYDQLKVKPDAIKLGVHETCLILEAFAERLEDIIKNEN